MLKKFFLNLLSSFLGAWIAILLSSVVIFLMVIAIVAQFGTSSSGTPTISKNTVLKLSLSGVIEEIEGNVKPQFTDLSFSLPEPPKALDRIVLALREGAKNKNVKALYIECDGVSAAPATLHALRDEIAEFKKSGKTVIAYGDGYTQGDYYVVSCADSIFLNPEGSVNLSGLSSESMYFGDLFKKVGIEVQVAKVGTYKSAVEPFIGNEMSAPARAQLDTLYTVMWDFIKDEIATSRKIKAADIDNMINNDFIFLAKADACKKHKLIDRAVYKRQIDDIIADIVDCKAKDLKYVSINTMAESAKEPDNYGAKNRIAVLYAVGDIAESPDAGIYCEKLVPIITELADDDDVEGMVLRVNSPGGSAFGSEQIREALLYFKSKGKKLAVAMGDYAASGGYWISSPADRIFADPLTVTGSIGIFGMFPNAQGLFEKIGIGINTVCTNPNGNIALPYKRLNDEQMEALQKYINEGYDNFIDVVSTGRNLSPAKVREIGEGRVWNAMTAKKLGLVDELGSINDAVKWIAKECDIEDDYNVAVYPQREPGFWDFFYMVDSDAYTMLAKELGGQYPSALIREMHSYLTCKPVQARMPSLYIRL